MHPESARTMPDDSPHNTNGHPNEDALERPERILIADDEHLVASGMAANLEAMGYEVVGPVNDGDAAIECCRTEEPDMVLLDIRMPGTDGIEAAKQIFREFGTPVLIFSAYSDPEYVELGSQAGVFGYLLKPVTSDQLRVGIEIAWSRFQELANQTDEITTLKERLENRKVIEQAKWILVKRRSVEEPEAMKLLQREARNNRRPLIEVAQAIVDSDNLLGG